MVEGDATTVTTAVPRALANGVPMLKISSKKIKQVIARIEDDTITWSSIKGTKIPICQIRELRLNQPPTGSYPSNRWITIVYATPSNQWKVLHMTAVTDKVYNLWVETLTALVSETSDRLVAQVTPTDPDLMWIRQLWPAGAKAIDFGTAAGLCGTLGLVIPKSVADEFGTGPIDLASFRRLLRKAQTRTELEHLYKSLSSSGPLDRTRVEAFLTEVQGMQPGDIFDQFKHGQTWNLDSLAKFLLSPANSQVREQDMTRPLPEYFVSSSHNTYLVGEQWRGESTVEGYIRVLLAKCRCVEMDCHNGDAEPEVFHKKTLTSKVSVREICQAISTYAFVSSPYPVIISAEIHCSLEQQERMASIMREVFGDRLVSSALHGISGMPSPEQLRGKILFKAKPPVVEDKSAKHFDYVPPESASSTESDSGFARLARRLSISSSGAEKPSFSPSLLELLVYTSGVKYQGFSKLIEYAPEQQFSVSERTAERIIRDQRADWIKHNFTHMSRIYPRGVRLDSSNYDPTPLWGAGCQLVALNWQTLDEGTTLNHAMFADSKGYVLKPPALRSKVVERTTKYRLKVSVLSAQRIPPSSDLYIEATLSDEQETEYPVKRTSLIKKPSLNPLWNERMTFEFETTPSMLALTFLHLRIKNKSLVAQWVRSIDAAPRGFRHLPLYDPLFSQYVFAKLFVRIDLEEIA